MVLATPAQEPDGIKEVVMLPVSARKQPTGSGNDSLQSLWLFKVTPRARQIPSRAQNPEAIKEGLSTLK